MNGGIGAARNRGIRESTGDVIALLDADDAWLPERVSRCVGFLRERPDVGFVTTDALIIDEQGSPSGGTYLDLVDFPVEGYEERIVRENFVFVGAFVRRAVLDDAGPFDETKPTGVEDYEMWLRLIASGVVPGIVRDPLALYRVRSDSVTRRDDQLVRARNLALRRHLPAYWQRGVYGPSGQAFSIVWDSSGAASGAKDTASSPPACTTPIARDASLSPRPHARPSAASSRGSAQRTRHHSTARHCGGRGAGPEP